MGKVNHVDAVRAVRPGHREPSVGDQRQRRAQSTDVIGQFTQVLSNRALNEFRVGYAAYGIDQESLTSWSQHWQAPNGITTDGPNITFSGFSDRPQQQPAALSRSERVHVPRQLLDVLRRRRPARPESRWRVSAPAGQHPQLQPLRRRHHRQRRTCSGKHRADSRRCVQRRYLGT